MGQRLTPNPYGDCATCGWSYNYTPYNLTVEFIGVQPAAGNPRYPVRNSLFTLYPRGYCYWTLFNSQIYIEYNLHGAASVYAEIFVPAVGFYLPYFSQFLGESCVTEFVNQLTDPPDFYHNGTAVVMAGLPHPPHEFVDAYGLVGADNWKYEHLKADNNLEQVYIGSRKYKANCRILFDPDQIDV